MCHTADGSTPDTRTKGESLYYGQQEPIILQRFVQHLTAGKTAQCPAAISVAKCGMGSAL